MSNASRSDLIALITKAHDALVESQRHSTAVVGLSGDERFKRQQLEAEALLRAMLNRIAMYERDRH